GRDSRDRQRAVPAVERLAAELEVVLQAHEVRQHVVPAPAGAPCLFQRVEVVRRWPQGDLTVDGRASADAAALPVELVWLLRRPPRSQAAPVVVAEGVDV